MADVTKVSDLALWCRTERHLWLWERDTTETDSRGRMVAFVRHSTCERCGATRERTISTLDWRPVGSKIRYPKGYLVTDGRLQHSQVYREQFERSLSRAESPAP